MKWINGYTWQERCRLKYTRKSEWHKWFAWYPVTIKLTEEKRKVKIWLETIERKGDYYSDIASSFWSWEYRELSTQL